MSFTLGDCENDILSLLGSQNPPANYGVGGVTAYPLWASIQGTPRFNQGVLDNAINRSLQRVISGLNDLDIINYSFTFGTTSQVYKYAMPQNSVAQGSVAFTGAPKGSGVTVTVTIGGYAVVYATTASDTSLANLVSHIMTAINASTAVTSGAIVQVSPQLNAINTITLTAAANGVAGNAITLSATSSNGAVIGASVSGSTLTGGTASNPNIQQLRRVYYQPQGQLYQRENAAGSRLIAWGEFLEATAGGYLAQFSFATEPDYISLSPDRQWLNFWPGPASTGDLVTVEYVPAATASTGQPVLVNQTDIVPLPDDLRDLLVLGAMYWVWPVAGQFGLRAETVTEFKAELARIREDWSKASAGESQRIVDALDMRAATAWCRR